jgi:hypothetical protein
MYKDERMYLENKAAEMELPSIEEQANPPPKPLQVDLDLFVLARIAHRRWRKYIWRKPVTHFCENSKFEKIFTNKIKCWASSSQLQKG